MAAPYQPPPAAAARSPRYIQSIDPATGVLNGRFDATDPLSLPIISAWARGAQEKWAGKTLRDRCAMIQRLRDVIFDSRDEIVDAITHETGKPRVEALFAEILLALDSADFLARRAPRWLRPERISHHNVALKAKSAHIEFEPLGVVAVISPWNYPFSIPLAQVIPALLAGNAVLLKPSELTPWTGSLIGELFARAKFPSYLVQVLQGAGDLGAAIIEAGPDKVFFTGSVATGRLIAEACGGKLIPSVLELGGKDAMIVLADAHLETASSAAVWGSFTNCGQACLSVERIYVERAIAAKFTDLCVQKTKQLRIGPGSDPDVPDVHDVEVGPMIHVRQLEKVEEQLREAEQGGATVLTGGIRRLDLGPNFFAPTVIADVSGSMRIMREETFGPVLAIQAVESADEAILQANDSPFALSGSIWTSDARRGRELASRMRAGSVMVNDVASYYGVAEAPHGGRGASGWGRTHSRLGLLEMVHSKYVDVDLLPRVPKSWWYGYSAEIATAADRFVDLLFARDWKRRRNALLSQQGARRLVFRGHRI